MYHCYGMQILSATNTSFFFKKWFQNAILGSDIEKPEEEFLEHFPSMLSPHMRK